MPIRPRRKSGKLYDPNVLLKKTKLRVEEAAELLDVASRTVQRYMRDGKIAFTSTPGGQRRLLTNSVRKYL